MSLQATVETWTMQWFMLVTTKPESTGTSSIDIIKDIAKHGPGIIIRNKTYR